MTVTAPAMTLEDLLAQLHAILAAAEGRSLTDEEVDRYESLEADLALVRRDQEIRTRQRAYETPVVSRSDLHVFTGSTVVERSDQDIAFEHYMRTGQVNGDLIERAQSEGTDSAGGYLVPDGFLQKIVERKASYGGIASVAETITTDSGNPLPFPTNDDTANSAEIVAEAAAPVGGADLVFGVKTLGAYKYSSQGPSGVPIKVSVELLQDSAFDLEAFLAKALGARIARKQARDFAIGSGSGEPQGLLTGLTSSHTNAGAVPTYGELLAATFAVDEQYLQGGAEWVMHNSILAGIQGIVDLNGRPLLNMSTDGISGTPSRTLLGYPVVVDNAMPSAWTTGATPVGQKTIVFGSVSDAYLIRQVKGVTLVVLREMYALNGQVGFMAWARADAIVQDPNAATALTGHV